MKGRGREEEGKVKANRRGRGMGESGREGTKCFFMKIKPEKFARLEIKINFYIPKLIFRI